MAGATEVVAAATKSAWWKPSMSRLKAAPMVGLLAGAAVIAPFIFSSFRESKRFDENAPLPMPKPLSDPLPPVLDYNAPESFKAPSALDAPAGDKLHNDKPLEEGDWARTIRMQRAGLNASPNVTPPNVLTPNNLSAIDGKPLTELNGKHVKNAQKEPSGTPGFMGPG